MRQDWKKLIAELKPKYPYAFAFKSGIMGSGLVTLSRWPIQQAFFKRFTLSGEPHRILHGEWFSGKGIGCCRIKLPNGRLLDFYNIHTHAEYDWRDDVYMSQRLSQLQEATSFVELSTRAEHVAVLAGDLNTVPGAFLYKLFFKKPHCLSPHSPLEDTFAMCNQNVGSRTTAPSPKDLQAIADIEAAGYSYNLPKSSYHSDKKTIERLDYVMVAPRAFVRVEAAGVAVEDKVFGANISLSDHCPIWAQFDIASADGNELTSSNAVACSIQQNQADEGDETKVRLATEAMAILDAEIARVNKSIYSAHFFAFAFLGLTALISLGVSVAYAFISLPPRLLFALFHLQPALIAGAVFAFFMARIYLQEHVAAVVSFRREWKLFAISRKAANPPTSGKRNSIFVRDLGGSRAVEDLDDDLKLD